MEKKITYRALIFDDDQVVRSILWTLLDQRGYEVFTFPHPGLCPLCEQSICPCPLAETCTDVILTDLEMPVKKGIDFIEEQLQKGCKCKNMALMSGLFTNEDLLRANSLGIKVFFKPFSVEDVIEWVEKVEKEIDDNRKLSSIFYKQKEKR